MNTQSLNSIQVTGIVDNTAAHSPIVINANTYSNSTEDNQYYFSLIINSLIVGNYIDFNITFPINYQIRFTCTASNNANTFSVSGASTALDRISQLINENPVLSSLYTTFVDRTATGSGNTLYIISKNPGSQYNLQNVITYSFANAAVSYSFFDTPYLVGEGQKISDLYLFCDVRVARSKTNITTIPQAFEYYENQSFRLPFNKFDNHYFDISDFLKNFLSIPRPINYSINTMQQLQQNTTGMVWYSLDFGYIYSRSNSDIPIKQSLRTFKNLKAFNAALPRGESNNFDKYVKGVNSSGLAPVKFLTAKTSQVIKRNGFNILYFWLPAQGTITLKYYIEFKDGSKTAVSGNYATYQTVQSVTNANPSLYYIMHNVNDFLTSQERINNKTAASYSLVVVNGTNQVVVSERTFKIDDKFYEFQYDIVYQNSLGGYDTVQFTGKSTRNPQRDIKQYIASDLITFKPGDTYQGIKEVSLLNSYSIKSGWMKFKEIDDLKELLKSTSVFKIDRLNQRFESIQIVSSDYSAKDGSDLYQITITVNDTATETSIVK